MITAADGPSSAEQIHAKRARPAHSENAVTTAGAKPKNATSAGAPKLHERDPNATARRRGSLYRPRV